MGRPRKIENDQTEPEELEAKVRFLALWSADRGVFKVGDEAELPAEIAASLVREGVAERV